MPKTYNTNCCVLGCKSRMNIDKALHFHIFPRPDEPPMTIVNSWGTKEKVNRRKLWEVLLLKKEATPMIRVCSLHFRKEDYLPKNPAAIVKKARLKKTAVPSLNLPKVETKLLNRKRKRSISKGILDEGDVTAAKSPLQMRHNNRKCQTSQGKT